MRYTRVRLLIIAAAVAVIATAEAVAVFQLPAPPSVTEIHEPEEVAPEDEPTPPAPDVVVSPAKVPPDFEVAVTARCRGESAMAVSEMFQYSYSLSDVTSAGLATGTVYVGGNVPPGTYEVKVKCATGPLYGSAQLQVVPPPGGVTRGEGLTAMTRVTVTTAPRDEIEEALRPRFEEPADAIYVKIGVAHEWRLRADDPDLARLRSGAALTAPGFVEERLGEVAAFTEGADLSVQFGVPRLRIDPKSGQVVVTVTGAGYATCGQIGARSCRLSFWPPMPGEGITRPASHEIIVTAPGLMVMGVTGATPGAQEHDSIRFDGTRITRVVFGEDTPDSVAGVAAYLAGDSYGDVVLDPGETDMPPGEQMSWQFASALYAVVFLVIFAVMWTFVRSLGVVWWRRRDNWLLVLWVVIFYAAGAAAPDLTTGLTALIYGLLLGGLPVLVLVLAGRRMGPPPWPGSVLTLTSIAGALAGALLAGSGLAVLTETSWWLVILLPIAALLATTLRRTRRHAPMIAVLLLGTGVLVTVRIGQLGWAPGYATWSSLLALDVILLLGAGWAVAAGRWPARGFLWLGATLILAITVAMWQTQAESIPLIMSWDEFALLIPGVSVTAPLLLALLSVMLVVRLRRLGHSPAAVFAGEASSTMTLGLFLTQLVLALAYVSLTLAALVTIVIMWATVEWLLSGPAALRAKSGPDVTGEQHRALVRAMVGRRFARAALTDLLRQGRGRVAAGEMPVAVFEKQRRTLLRASDDATGPIDSDLALSTAAGRTPWQGAVAAFGVGLVLSIPFTTVRLIQTTSPDGWVPVLATASIAPLLCAIFGFFYPRVRGDQPLSKSLSLLLAAVVIALPSHVSSLVVTLTADPAAFVTPLPTPAEVLIGAVLAMGNLTVVCLGLGLFWEWRLLRLATEPWVRIRSLRSARAVAAPLTAVVIAAGTAVATALVNNAVAPLPTVSVTRPPAENP
ncbi:hypothetical protein GCM10009555_054860 [Acrocarpospora macrocephala]|uniref:Uncharacterized protein n=1 Tax=Acrocarpospora macrocephala TaxID=150177 RepID=A0A5M3WQE0_9ACTN|nr:hypothetical protein [Acrocarpospora macrocephala]GES10696.1 hypothetical protein Amac_042930 [Acrocarpospora macrocephala]